MARILALLADGTEEMEFVITVDVLRRVGFEVLTASIGPQTVTGSRRVRLVADASLAQVSLGEFDGIVVPGGGAGVEAMCRDARTLEAVRWFHQQKKLVAAICAGPMVLHRAGILAGRKFTCYPGVEAQISGAVHQTQRVVRDGHIITSQGPGTAFAFALEIVRYFEGGGKARDIARTALIGETDD